MKRWTKRLFFGVAAAAVVVASPANAAITMTLVDSYNRSGAFGLAYDGSSIWWSDSSGFIHEMTTGGVDTGDIVAGPYWSALGYDSLAAKLVVMQGSSTTAFDRSTSGTMSYASLNPLTTAIAGGYGGLIDGLDVEGSTLWWSPDVDAVYHSPKDGSGSATTFLPSAGGYSGVEYVSVGGQNYVIVVNDATNPRQLCVHDILGTQIGCTTLPNSRYEDLAFDGRYLYAADFYGGRVDKIDLFSDGGSIFVPGGVPEPSTWAMLLLGFGFVGSSMRARRRRSAPSKQFA